MNFSLPRSLADGMTKRLCITGTITLLSATFLIGAAKTRVVIQPEGPSGPPVLTAFEVYRGDKVRKGPELSTFKLAVGEKMRVTAIAVDDAGRELPVRATKISWRSNSQLIVKSLDGNPLAANVKAVKPGRGVVLSVVYSSLHGEFKKTIEGEVVENK